MTGTLFSFGHGYTARALSRRLALKGWRIVGTTRDAAEKDAIRAAGAEPLVWPGEAPDLDGVTHLLISTAPTAKGDPVLAALRDEIAARAGQFDWVGYLSTTAVYGDHKGGWVDETTPATPTAERGRWRLQAEQDWAAIPGLPLHIFRLAGIYGPGRGPFSKLKKGGLRRIIKPGQVFSRIHVEDIALAGAIAARKNKGGVYNLCDDEPAPAPDVVEYAANLMGVDVPPLQDFETMKMSPMARSFYGECKRCSNKKLLKLLGGKMRYPTYREAFSSMWEKGNWRG
ncbi:MAG TPA: NAD(P)-dependent oxidoreductase [Rhodobacteraceae bacterium]|nr:NAD(P)-dependent oxidoreductase [Paracoccaceae bacterium]